MWTGSGGRCSGFIMRPRLMMMLPFDPNVSILLILLIMLLPPPGSLDTEPGVGTDSESHEDNNHNGYHHVAVAASRSKSHGGNNGGGGSSWHKNDFGGEIVTSTILGKVKGRVLKVTKTEGSVGAFLGLPYAQPPIHNLRFRPPMELEKWPAGEDGFQDGTEFGSICWQPGEQKIWDVVYTKSGRGIMRKRKLEAYNMSEDCLTLNIYVPLEREINGTLGLPELLPVLFFIHGGSYYMNAGRLYPGQVLASSENIIVVTFNYRLGPFGFLSTGDGAAPGNYGMLDQAMALDWVHRHIPFFGGNPHHITLVGNSAGAASVMFHMFSPLSRGKFVGVTVQSGCSGAPWAIQLAPQKHAKALASKLKCPASPTTDLVDCIRTFSPQLIMKYAKLEDGLSLAYATVIDGPYGGQFLLDHPESLIKSKTFESVPVLTGFTRNEVTIWFTKFGPTIKTKDLRTFVQVDVVSLLENVPTVTQANKAAMIHSVNVQYLYRAGTGENDTMGKTSSVSDFISDVGLKAPCIREMNLLAKYNSRPVFLYEFAYFSVDDFKMGKQEWIGAYHESELQFIFGEPYLNYSNHLRSYDDPKISDLMMKVWGDFIRHGTPTPKESATSVSNKKPSSGALKFQWANYSESNQDFAVLGLKSHMERYFLTDRMLFWNFFFPIFRDYPFRFDPNKERCSSWDHLQQSWILWALICLTLGLSLALVLLLGQKLRSRANSRANGNHHPPILTNSTTTTPTNNPRL